jgi:hypothetical protein
MSYGKVAIVCSAEQDRTCLEVALGDKCRPMVKLCFSDFIAHMRFAR